MRIEKLSVAKDGDETGNAMNLRQASVELREGRVHAFLPTAGPSRAELTMHTSAGTLVANAGSLFSVKLDGELIHVLCLRGEVRWAGSASVTIQAGFYIERKLNEQGDATPRPASEAASAQLEVLEALDSAKTIAELEETARNAPKPWLK